MPNGGHYNLLELYITCVKQCIVWKVLCEGTIFSILLLPKCFLYAHI
jgi:hypothetical protein